MTLNLQLQLGLRVLKLFIIEQIRALNLDRVEICEDPKILNQRIFKDLLSKISPLVYI